MNESKRNQVNKTPTNTGSIIRHIRKLRGYTLLELGIKAGFSPTNADIRIAQYEQNHQMPRGKTLENLAKGLGVDVNALLDVDFSNSMQMYHALFEMERFQSLHPEVIEGKYVLAFSDCEGAKEANVLQHEKFLEEWYSARNFYLPIDSDSPSTIERKKKDFELWKFEYPKGEASGERDIDDIDLLRKENEELKKEIERLRDLMKKRNRREKERSSNDLSAGIK